MTETQLEISALDLELLPVPPLDTQPWIDTNLFWPEHPRCSNWVEESMILDPRVTSTPGQVTLSHMNYIREPLDSFSDPGVRDIDLEWSTQTGKTFALLCMGAYTMEEFPLPTLLTLPTEDILGDMMTNRFGVIVETTPILRKHMRGGRRCITKNSIKLDRMTVYGAWAGSPATLASRAIGVSINDEVNKWPAQSGKEASPLALIGERLRTYHRISKMVVASTPTIPGGLITVRYEASDKRTYRVPCPHCGEYQVLTWANVRYPGREEASKEEIKHNRLAWYLCAHCEERIDESEKAGMVKRGVWCPEGCDVSRAGEVVGDIPISDHRGYRINALYSPWLTWSDTVHKYLESYRFVLELMNFTNSWLGEVWEEVVGGVRLDMDDNISKDCVLGTPPADTICLIAGGDVQGVKDKKHIWYSVHALCSDERIQLVEYGKLAQDSDQTDFDRLWDEVMCGTWRTEDGRDLEVLELGIDRRWRTPETDKFARRAPHRITLMSGASATQGTPLQQKMIDQNKSAKKVRNKNLLTYQSMNTLFFKDQIALTVQNGNWIIPIEGTEEYQRQFVSEQRCIERDAKGNVTKIYWGKRRGHKDNHLFDTSDYATACAYKRGFFNGTMVMSGEKKEWFKGRRKKRGNRR